MRCLRPIGYTITISSRHGSCNGDEPVIRRHPAREERVDLVGTKRCQKIIRERSLIALSMTQSSTISDNVSSRATPAIELRNVTKRFLTPSSQVYTAIRDFTLSVAPGEFCAVVGPTGCGNSTTLRLERLRFKRLLDWIAQTVVFLLHDGSTPYVALGDET